MFRVWGLLAAAMLLGSALLGWLEPKPHRNALAGAPRESMLNDAATLDDRTSPLRHWNGVEIVGVPGANTRNRGTLTAVVRQPELHFLINASGAAEVQPGWTQQAAVGQDGSIRIGLEQSADDGTAHIKQIVRLTELITELRTTVSADEVSTLPVWFNGGSDQQPLANQLRRFLK
jgi:hypothetical protein